MQTPTRVATIGMGCEDTEKTRAFLEDVIGIPMVYSNHGRLGFDVGETRLLARPLQPGETLSPVYIYLEVDDAQAVHDHVRAAGADIVEGVTTEPWGEIDFGVREPNGHYIYFTQQTERSWRKTSTDHDAATDQSETPGQP